jgi:hypothetical protein
MASIERTATGDLILTAQLPPEATGAIVLPMIGETPGTPQRAAAPPKPDPTPDPPPIPTPAPDLTKATMLVVGGQGFAIDGVDRPRLSNEIILYIKAAVPDLNMWGTDVGIVDGKVVAVVARERDKIPAQTPRPSGGVLVSAHGASGARLAAAVHVGDSVTWRFDAEPDPTPNPAPTPATGALIGVYMKVWNVDRVRAADLPAAANAVFLGFARNTPGAPPAMSGDTAFGLDVLKADLADLRTSGIAVGVSLGGSKGGIFYDNPATFVDGLAQIHERLGGFDLLDIDSEQGVLTTSAIAAIDDRLATRLPNVRWTAAPNGSYIDAYLPIVAELSRRGRLRYTAQQFYEGPRAITADDVRDRIRQALGKGIPADQIGIGMMVGSTYQYWTPDQCESIYRMAVEEFGVHHAYVWDLPRYGTAEVVARTRRHLESVS